MGKEINHLDSIVRALLSSVQTAIRGAVGGQRGHIRPTLRVH